jgi:hypothetical protein
MELVHEVTAYLENKPGRLAKICSTLAHAKINIQALAVMQQSERSVLRLVTADPVETRQVLTSLGTESEVCEVLSVELENRPGALSRVLETLAEEHINIEYAYVAPGAAQGRCLGIFHTSNPKKAQKVLAEPFAGANGDARGGDRRPLHTR